MSVYMSDRQLNMPNYLKFALLSFFALILAACNPKAEFSFTPENPIAGRVVTFDASASAANKPKEESIASYTWNFGDGSAEVTGKIVEHTFDKPGSYDVALTVVDTKSAKNTIKKKVTVAERPRNTAKVAVTGLSGELLAGAKVSVNAETASTDVSGLVSISVPENKTYVVKAELDGYVSQSVSVSEEALAFVNLTLVAEKFATDIDNISTAQTVKANELGATVSFEANTFVKADGTAATGKARAVITPWDVSSAELIAFLGNGEAVDSNGTQTQLISAGMMTVDFYDEAGTKLKIANGKTATIAMDVVTQSVNGNVLNNGTQIPMWSFDEALGKWKEEGVGSVRDGKITATVSHFSTWNWDFKFEAGGSVKVVCKDSTGNVACYVNALVNIVDGSKINKSQSLSAQGATIINMPTEANVTWKATTSNGQMGSISQAISAGDVVIPLKDPTTKHQVSCVLASGVATGCKGKASYTGDTAVETPFVLSKLGGTLRSSVENVNNVVFTASSFGVFTKPNGDVVRYKGNSTTTNAEGNVTITLDEEVAVTGDVFQVSCKYAISDASKPCTVKLEGFGRFENIIVNETYVIPFGEKLTLSYDKIKDVSFGSFVAKVEGDGRNQEGSFDFNSSGTDLKFDNDEVILNLEVVELS